MAFVLHKLLNKTSYCNKILASRLIMTSTSNKQDIIQDFQQNPYYEKYAHKIAKLQKTSPQEFTEKLESTIIQKQQQQQNYNNRYESLSKPKDKLLTRDVKHGNRKLSDIFKIELVEEKNADEIKDIWLKYHIQKDDIIAATIPVELYSKILERMKNYPVFLFALPRSQGYEFFVSQTSGDEIHITTLLCYQVHKENSPECLTLVHYTELSNKGIILMRGEYDKNVIDGMEAQCLVNQFQMYYGQDHPSKLALLDGFTNHPEHFKHMDLVNELENIELK